MEKDFLCGMISGIAQTIVGHPFDTIKIRTQCGVKTPLNPLSYFRGMTYNLMSAITCNAVIFGTQGFVSSSIADHHNADSHPALLYLAPGFISGICVTPIVFFFDIGKNKKQALGKKLSSSDFSQTRGLGTTILREPIAFSIYFATYKALKENHGIPPFWAGGISGLACWAFTYPLDVLRNRQITYNISVLESLAEGKLFKGFGVCLIRAFIVNSFGFYFYENAKNVYDYTTSAEA